MARRPRVLLPDIPLHIIQRGNNRYACFYSDEDYIFYIDTLAVLAELYGCKVHALCLMTNHVHLLLTPSCCAGAGLLMKGLGQRYVQYVNRTYQRTGTLWEGCFRSCLVQQENYVLACYRYIETNPVRAGMVAHPGDYCWTSYRANAQGELSGFISPGEIGVRPRFSFFRVQQSCSLKT
ncbi:Putative transposase [Pseudomonas antarctica]|jgi:putative transposase|uniref:Putative transposase n=1 Tax=Pseudomonas antarctica TaxID=219572 RepID=A0A172YTY0_9PSED|nr:transposase [Pseudomonas antarctica]ANF83628.1 Putative transposase [Pseudomonas antarctica]